MNDVIYLFWLLAGFGVGVASSCVYIIWRNDR